MKVLGVLNAMKAEKKFLFGMGENLAAASKLIYAQSNFKLLMRSSLQAKPNGEDSCSLKHLITSGNQQKTKLAS